MATKALNADQHVPLHSIYGKDDCCLCRADEEKEVLKREIDGLRKLLWRRHGCDVGALYGDDGEMQCGNCRIDFKTFTYEQIETRWLAQNKEILDK